MTELQSQKVDILYNEYAERCSSYSSFGNDEDCRFDIYRNDNNVEDKNITVYSSFISGLSDDYQPYYEIVNLLIDENGDTINLSTLLSPTEKKDYMNGLTKIN